MKMPKGFYTRTEEHRKKLSESHKDKHPSEETKRKISEAEKGKHVSLEVREKIRKKAKIGKKSSWWKGGINKDKKHLKELGKRRTHKRRTLEKGAIGFYTLGEWELLKKQYGYICPLCKRKEPEITLTIDHIIPISKGGSGFIENIQPLCKPCNTKKFTKIFRITPKGELMLF